jgi:hypothetical protein
MVRRNSWCLLLVRPCSGRLGGTHRALLPLTVATIEWCDALFQNAGDGFKTAGFCALVRFDLSDVPV